VITEYFPFAGLSHTARLRDNVLRVRISDLFVEAPEIVIYSLALILLAKLYRKRLDMEVHRVYREFILSPAIQEQARTMRGTRGRNFSGRGPSGKFFDLCESFDRLNRSYFASKLVTPHISWTEQRSKRTLGRYDPARHRIFISRVLDSASTPSFVVDYVMYHEMLHVRHQSSVHRSRIVFHTPEFRADERQFYAFLDAKRWLKNL